MKKATGKLRKTVTCILTLILAVTLTLSGISPASAADNPWSEDNAKFDYHLYRYLKSEMKYSLNQNLMQHVVYDKMKEHVGYIGQAIYELEAWASDNDYRIEGKKGLYETLLYDILKKQMESEAFRIQAESNASTVLEALGEGLKELGQGILEAGGDLYSLISDGETAWDVASTGADLIKEMGVDTLTTILKSDDAVGVLFEKLSGQFEENTKSSVISFLLSASGNGIEFVDEVIQYYSFTEFRDSQITFLQHVYRQTNDGDLQAALLSVINYMQGVNNDDISAYVARSGGKAVTKSGIDFAEVAVSLFIPTAALGSVVGLFSDFIWKADDIAMMALTLQAEVELEKAFIDGLKCQLSVDVGTIDRARAVNCGYGMLWTAYDYGIDLALDYFELVLRAGSTGDTETVDGLREIGSASLREMEVRETLEEVKSYADSFHKVVANYFAVVDEVYASYRREHPDQYGTWKQIRVYTPVKGIVLQQPVLRIPYEKWEELHVVGAAAVPADADNTGITFMSSNEKVVTVDASGIITVLGAGSARITAVTKEGGFRTVLTVIAEPEDAPETEQAPEEAVSVVEKYPEAFERNEDGYTVKQVIPEWVIPDTGVYDKRSQSAGSFLKQMINEDLIRLEIPETVDGVPVTEVDFSGAYYYEQDWAEWLEEGKTVDFSAELYTYEDQPKSTLGVPFDVVLPGSVKRIAPDCFDTWLGGIQLNEGLMSIGERAFCGWEPDATDAELIVPSTVTEIGEAAFAGCGSPRPLSVYFAQAEDSEQGLTVIPAGCFQGASLNAVVLPDTVREIGEGAFEECRVEEPMVLPDSLELIGNWAFANTKEVGKEYRYSTYETYLSYLPENRSAVYGVSVRIPDRVRVIGDGAFYGLRAEELILPDTVEEIGEEAFSHGTVRRVICAPASEDAQGTGAVIGKEAFAHCEYLEYLELPANVIGVEEEILRDSRRIKQLIWPDTLCYIGGTLGCWSDNFTFTDTSGSAETKSNETDGLLIFTKEGLSVSPSVCEAFLNADRMRKMEAFFQSGSLVNDAGREVWQEGIARLTLPEALMPYVMNVPGRAPGFGQRLILQKTMTEAEWGEYVRSIAGYTVRGIGNNQKVSYATWFEEIYCLNEAGEETLIYKAPHLTEKVSAFVYEDGDSYRTALGQETEELERVQVGELSSDQYGGYGGCTVQVNGNAEAVAALRAEELQISGWLEDYALSDGERAAALGRFADFEDAYLRQKKHLYLQIETASGAENGVSGAENGVSGAEYQLILTVIRDHSGESELEKEPYALYHIDEYGLAERVPIEISFEESQESPRRRTVVKAAVQELGSYALIYVDRTREEMSDQEYFEEVHEMWASSPADLMDGSYTKKLTEGTVQIDSTRSPQITVNTVPEQEAAEWEELFPGTGEEEVFLRLETGANPGQTDQSAQNNREEGQAGSDSPGAPAPVTVSLNVASEEPLYPIVYRRDGETYERQPVSQVIRQAADGREFLPDLYTRPYQLALEADGEYIVGFTSQADQAQLAEAVLSGPIGWGDTEAGGASQGTPEDGDSLDDPSQSSSGQVEADREQEDREQADREQEDGGKEPKGFWFYAKICAGVLAVMILLRKAGSRKKRRNQKNRKK